MEEESLISHPFSVPTTLFTSALLLLLLLLLSLLFFFFKARASSKPKAHYRLPPSPMGLPVVGHLHLLRAPIHRALHRLTLRHGPLIHVRLGSTLCVAAATADLARDLLKTHDAAFSDRPQTIAARHFAYDSAAFAFAPYGPYYRFMRRLCMLELLGSRTVDQLRPIRHAEVAALLRTLLEKSKRREPVNLSWEVIRLTNNEVTRMAASTTSSAVGGEAEEARELVKQVAELIGAFNLEDYIGFCRGWDPQGLSKRMRDVHARFDGLLERIIKGKEEARRSKKKKNSNREGGEEDDDGVVKDVLDILLDVAEDEKAEMKLSRENIKGFIMDIFTAGSDSSAASIEWALAEILNHPRVLQKLRQEIDQVVGNGRIVDETDLPNLPYLQAAVKETLRLHPPAPIIHRQATRDVTVEGYVIPAGTALFVNVWSVGRDPKYWEDPSEFRPERFVDDRAVVDMRGQHFQLIPFGSGRRGCPGMTLALQAVPVAVAALMQCFDWEVSGESCGSNSGSGREEKGTLVDMEEGIGLVSARAHPLILVPVPRLDPFPEI
ncbi:cytochrome P450 93A2-like [Ananas comosus]|uniref:Cytochrome P450 93A2-like n=1 Tax=Ananas comosus TaxID=4615 RepID=A0A6P5F533_ANACO|nr:cytochrome P450 93A2-like [Ananas comosus]